jgi:hypothetical protein
MSDQSNKYSEQLQNIQLQLQSIICCTKPGLKEACIYCIYYFVVIFIVCNMCTFLI